MRRSPPMGPQHRGEQIPFYQMARRSSNISPMSGARSPPYHERHSAIRLVCPCSNKVICTRTNRVLPTAARAVSGAAVCEDFLYTQGCPLGEMCPKVHVHSAHTWNYITPEFNRATGLYENKFFIQCYDSSMSKYYHIKSENVLPTAGSAEYITMHNDHGQFFKKKFKICESMITQGTCNLGPTCEDIHTIFADLSSHEADETHLADPEALAHYPRLTPDVIVRVFEQNSNESYHDFTGDQILVTAGAKQYLAALEAEGQLPKKKMQHCAHFRTKNLCRMGENCRFLHVVPDFNAGADSSQTNGISPNRLSRGDSPTSEINVNIRVRPPGVGMSGSQAAAMVAQKYGQNASPMHGSINQSGPTEADFSGSNAEYQSSIYDRHGRPMHGQRSPAAEPARVVFPSPVRSANGSTRGRVISPSNRHDPYSQSPIADALQPPQQRPTQRQPYNATNPTR